VRERRRETKCQIKRERGREHENVREKVRGGDKVRGREEKSPRGRERESEGGNDRGGDAKKRERETDQSEGKTDEVVLVMTWTRIKCLAHFRANQCQKNKARQICYLYQSASHNPGIHTSTHQQRIDINVLSFPH
jgi:hypothetical protein